MRKLKDFPYALPLIGAYPVVGLYAYNISQLEVSYLIRPLLACIGFAFLCYFLSRALTRKHAAAVILACFLVLITFAFGIIRDYGRLYPILGIKWGAFPISIPLWMLLTLAGGWLIAKRLKNAAALLPVVNMIAIALFVLPTYQILTYQWRQRLPSPEQPIAVTAAETAANQSPDIYLIVVDAYSRQDVLQEELGFDNAAMIDELTRLGFYVAPCSGSNYSATTLQVAAVLNLDYHAELTEGQTIEPYIPAIRQKIANSYVQRYLSARGYQIISFHNYFSFLNLPASDVYYDFRETYHFLTPFETMLLEKTPPGAFIFQANVIPAFKYYPKYAYDSYVLDRLEEIPAAVPGPKFVYAHILMTHPPYIFGPDGAYIGDEVPEEYANQSGYTDQITYLNQRLLAIIHRIMADSPTPPVILIQSDHGQFYAPHAIHQSVLNAFYLPGTPYEDWAASLSPVNSFRLVFNRYFGENLPLLPDRNYYLQAENNAGNERSLQLYQAGWPGCK